MATSESNQNIQDNQNNDLDDEENMRRRSRKGRRNIEEQSKENIVKSGNHFIITFKNLLQNTNAQKEDMCHYMERVLHSIFFFGYIHRPRILPHEFLPEQKMGKFKIIFPKPFIEFNTHLPCYTPFSILLEYMVNSLKPENPKEFLNKLKTVKESLLLKGNGDGNNLVANAFAASVVTYCYIQNPYDGTVIMKAYGSSMSCKGRIQKEIMIAISALHVWDKAISYAVSCAGRGPPLTFPVQVYCKPYELRLGREIPPCTKCFKMYAVEFNPEYTALGKKEDWPCGNCAENESLSRLLQSDTDVGKGICIMGNNGKQVMNREDIENKFKEKYENEIQSKVRKLLTNLKFELSTELLFFTPSLRSIL